MSAIDLAAAFVREHEGCRLTAYQDGGGRWTVGWGHTGPEVHAGLIWTQEQADDELETDLAATSTAVSALVHTYLSDQQRAALYSLAFNLGIAALHGTQILIAVNSGEWLTAGRRFLDFDHDNGSEVKGLLIRRLEEAALFLKGS